MTKLKDNIIHHIRGQYERLGYFLIASAFLIAVFVQLVIADKKGTLVNACTLLILVHAIAILGMLISALYSFMNFWLWRSKLWRGQRLQVVHTFLIPALFLAFWLTAWYMVTHKWFAFPIVGGFILLCAVYQKYRHVIDSLLVSISAKLRRLYANFRDKISQSKTNA